MDFDLGRFLVWFIFIGAPVGMMALMIISVVAAHVLDWENIPEDRLWR